MSLPTASRCEKVPINYVQLILLLISMRIYIIYIFIQLCMSNGFVCSYDKVHYYLLSQIIKRIVIL